MDWRVFFNRIRFSRTILFFIAILVIMGIAVILAGGYNLIFAFFIFLLAVITAYIKSIGLIILWLNKRYRIASFIFIDSLVNIIIMVLFGYKYVTILNSALWVYISYIILWAVYIISLYLKMVNGVNYYIYYLRNKKQKQQ